MPITETYDKGAIRRVLEKHAKREGLQTQTELTPFEISLFGATSYADVISRLRFCYETLQVVTVKRSALQACMIMLDLLEHDQPLYRYGHRIEAAAHAIGASSTEVVERKWMAGINLIAANYDGLMLLYRAHQLAEGARKRDPTLFRNMESHVRENVLDAVARSF